MSEKANRSQDPKKSRPTTPPGGTFLGRASLKLIFVRFRLENLSFPVFIGYGLS